MNIETIRKDFPILEKQVNGKPLTYFDNACLSLKPVQVIKKIKEYYAEYSACGGRSMHSLSKRVDEEVDRTRKTLQKFINAKHSEEIIFSKNTTESLNLVAQSFNFSKGDVVLTSDKEHNSNLLPWMQLRQKGVVHKIIPSNSDNTFNIEKFKEILTDEVKLVSIVQTSNLDGVTFPLKEIIKIAHDNKTFVVIDAAQSAPHINLNVKKLGADFLAFSGHKMLGPTGTGVLYGKRELLEKLSPFIVGGETVVDSTYENADFEKPPHRFEAGLQNYAGIAGLGEATKYLMKIREDIHKHEIKLNRIITEGLGESIKIIGPNNPELRGGIVSFTSKMDPHEIALMLDQQGIMIRSGAHCVHSWFNAKNLQGSARASLYLYNTEQEAETFVEEAKKILDLN